MNTVSVVVPAHDRAAVLGRAVHSALAQRVGLELIVVDDGSTDDTAQVASSSGDARVTVVRLSERRGVSAARNAGIAAARGRFVAFLDSDDEWLPGKLESQLACWKDQPAAPPTVVTCRYTRVNDLTGRATPPERPMFGGDAFRQIVAGQGPLPSTVLLPREAIDALGGLDERLPALADYELWLRLADASVRFVEVSAPLVVKHDHGTRQISGDPEALLAGFAALDERWGRRIRERCGDATYRRWRHRMLASIEYVRVRRAMAIGRRLSAWRHCLSLAGHAPWAPGYAAYGVGLASLGLGGYDALARLKDAARRARAT